MDAGRLAPDGCRLALAAGRAAGRETVRRAVALFFVPAAGLALFRDAAVVALGLVVVALGLAALGLVVVALGFAALGFATFDVAVLGFAAVRGLAEVARLRVTVRAREARAVVAFGLAVPLGPAALAAVMSALEAEVMALVAVSMARRALDILTDELAFAAGRARFAAVVLRAVDRRAVVLRAVVLRAVVRRAVVLLTVRDLLAGRVLLAARALLAGRDLLTGRALLAGRDLVAARALVAGRDLLTGRAFAAGRVRLTAVALRAVVRRAVVLLPVRGLLVAEDLMVLALLAVRALLVEVLLALALVPALGLLTARPVALVLRALVRAVLAAPRRAGLRVVACRGIDLPP